MEKSLKLCNNMKKTILDSGSVSKIAVGPLAGP